MNQKCLKCGRASDESAILWGRFRSDGNSGLSMSIQHGFIGLVCSAFVILWCLYVGWLQTYWDGRNYPFFHYTSLSFIIKSTGFSLNLIPMHLCRGLSRILRLESMRREQRQLQTNPIHQKSPARRAFHDCGEDGPLSKVPARMALKGPRVAAPC